MRDRSIKFWVTYLSIAAFSSLIIMEVVVRILGYSAWDPDTTVDIVVEPGGKLFEKDSLLGYRQIAGEYHVTLPTGHEFDFINNEETNRITRPSDSYLEEQPLPEVWIFGGSFVQGWSLNDFETFPWRIQDRFPDVDVINFGVGGYGTIQTLLKIDDLLSSNRKPELVVIAYSALHDERNTLLRSRIKEVSAWNHLGDMGQPTASVASNDSLEIVYRDIKYRTVPFIKYSALAHCVDLAINKIQNRFTDSHGVTRKILHAIYERGETHGFPVVLAHIYAGPDSPDLMEWARSTGFHVVDISVDLQEEGMSNRPRDAHPSALANKYYSESLGNFLVSEMLLGE